MKIKARSIENGLNEILQIVISCGDFFKTVLDLTMGYIIHGYYIFMVVIGLGYLFMVFPLEGKASLCILMGIVPYLKVLFYF